jgi:hypothetical protein
MSSVKFLDEYVVLSSELGISNGSIGDLNNSKLVEIFMVECVIQPNIAKFLLKTH